MDPRLASTAGKKENLVPDYRSADVKAVAFFRVGAGVDVFTFQAAAAQAVVGVIVKSAAKEVVAARLGHGVDVTRRRAETQETISWRDDHAWNG